MRIIKILLFLLITCQVAFATDTELAKVLESLTPQQRTVLYQYGTLRTYATPAQADSFWQQHQISNVTVQQAGLLATELLVNTELEYTIKKPSRLQALRGLFTASRLLLGLAALVAAYALVQLLSRYWGLIRYWLVRLFSPLFRWLFSPRMLTYELLLISIAGIYFGPRVPDLVIRTIVIHVGVFVFWAQLTAIVTRKHFITDYKDVVKNTLKNENKPWEAFLQVTVPAGLTTAAVAWVIHVCPDLWYPYEVTIPALVGVYALPPLRRLEAPLSHLFYPFANSRMHGNDRRIAAYVILTLVAWVLMLALPVVVIQPVLVLTVCLTFMLLLLSIERITYCGIKNYIWMQVITVGFLVAAILIGAQLSVLLMSWIGMGGILLYILIKYWEIPVLLGWSWKNRKAWGALGMAMLIWGIGELIRHKPEWFVLFY
ncbi:hypothetical protein CLV51_1021265 [Chitinophaga niastensis]|uniref:Uncharacterized protein n=1 Tax=Chitinophaga niastensis TaxID=536980 RepID=A0A2P8HQB1_CHINA|nr:hypothetical protein [Chitinophaga niastensis]PSL48398.1 hypothetical protein CLV51_1021265 [Chitinophaga niastensis]